jgi:hypothetical protein
MTYEQAQKILDRVKDGTAYSRKIIDEALWLTGDIGSHEAMRGEELENENDQTIAESRIVARTFFL